MALQEKDLHNENIATRDVVGRREPVKHKFVTAVEKGFYLRERKRGETFSVPADMGGSWFVDASEGDVRRSQEAVEVDMARAHASPRYEPANSPAAVRAANAARADTVKAQQPAPQHDETPEEKAARLQAEERAKVDQAQRTAIVSQEEANRRRETSEANTRAGSPASRQSPEQAEQQADASIRIGALRDEASKLEATGGKENKRKAQELREEANTLSKQGGSDLA